MGIILSYPTLARLAEAVSVPLLVIDRTDSTTTFEYRNQRISEEPIIGVLIDPVPKELQSRLIKDDTVLIDLVGRQVITGNNRLACFFRPQKAFRITHIPTSSERMRKIEQIVNENAVERLT